MIVRSFAPIAAPDAHTLILGSMPGIASLEAGQYYAHQRNAFWPIMGALYGAGPDLPYAERVSALKASGVAVWDVLQSCVREGSLDADIRSEVPNDFAGFFAAHPAIRRIGLNGGKAAATFRKYAARCLPVGARVQALPSTSPAHAARGIEEKCTIWRVALLS
ncbi:MAG: DNA-deoxyinosine glycosylase [Hyphomonas sp.]|uniref:DNA-deoxyinosine glycosylase n=1 Tax=Hyphomonas sp. TaxID=87 RepID=UPI0025BABE97|nr:DNA-deoxyinosine glycosylase [Hyphomonas sp.]MBA4339734.1 DNA-deoxyinosine glycosylase [Hyphomonas sp.]